ncbi:DUF4272 domain-containing protein [Sphingomonas sp. Sphisp140]|uniref:DUF4272 domain-containing protein n=1 Tax=unclassified Sphingomonas TaxID=196159 RepID=UPI0039AF9C41
MGLLDKLLRRGGAKSEPLPTDDEGVLVNAYATVRDLPPLGFSHIWHNQRDLSDPELAAHLDGFAGYVMSRGDGQMTAARYHLWRHVQRVRHQLSFSVSAEALGEIEHWARDANAILFLPDGSVRAPDGAVLINGAGESDPAAALPYPPDAVARRERTLEHLAGITPRPPASMPPALGEAELLLRPAGETLPRALALACVAVHAENLQNGDDDIRPRLRELNLIGMASLTPKETAFLEAESPDAQTVTQMGWRYEALNTLLWALGNEAVILDASDRIADAAVLARAALEFAQAPHADPRFRPIPEILDALDRTWRMQWIVREAHKTGPAPAGLNPDVLTERHVALNWLTGFQNDPGTPWDEIDTPS